MAGKIDCWRCGRKNAVDDLVCGGCGIEEPQRDPNVYRAKTGVAGSSASADAWSKFAERTPPAVSQTSPGYAASNARSTQRTVASRLVAESGVAITYLYVVGALASAVLLILFLMALFSDVDGGVKFLSFLTMLVSVVGVWLAVFLIVPFYTYMNLRGHDYKSRD